MKIQVNRNVNNEIQTISLKDVVFRGYVGSTFAEMFPGDATEYVLRSEQEENERNNAIAALAQKYANAVANKQDYPIMQSIWNEFEELINGV